MLELGKGDGEARTHADFRAYPVMHLLEEKRQTQCLVQVAGDLEQAAILSLEINWRYGRLRRYDQPGGEILPLRVNRARMPDAGRGGDAAGGKYNQASPCSQMGARLGPRFQID